MIPPHVKIRFGVFWNPSYSFPLIRVKLLKTEIWGIRREICSLGKTAKNKPTFGGSESNKITAVNNKFSKLTSTKIVFRNQFENWGLTKFWSWCNILSVVD